MSSGRRLVASARGQVLASIDTRTAWGRSSAISTWGGGRRTPFFFLLACRDVPRFSSMKAICLSTMCSKAFSMPLNAGSLPSRAPSTCTTASMVDTHSARGSLRMRYRDGTVGENRTFGSRDRIGESLNTFSTVVQVPSTTTRTSGASGSVETSTEPSPGNRSAARPVVNSDSNARFPSTPNPTWSTELGSDKWAMRQVDRGSLASLGCCTNTTRVRLGTGRNSAQKHTRLGRRHLRHRGRGTIARQVARRAVTARIKRAIARPFSFHFARNPEVAWRRRSKSL